jgi:tRNA(His) 5'-end guanylyltransferase
MKIDDRMKDFYENRTKQFLMRRMITIIRLDGKGFSKFTKDLDKPFDDGFSDDMDATAVYLCENIQGAKFAYTQSDEISIVLVDYDNLETLPLNYTS